MATIINFLQEIPEDKKKLLELKFTIYTHADCNQEIGKWACLIIDNKYKQSVLHSEEKCNSEISQLMNKNRMELQAIVQGLKQIEQKFTDDIKPWVCVEYRTNNVYCSNLLKEWIHLWAQTEFAGRPNADLMPEALRLIKIFDKNLEIKWSTTVGSEEFEACHKLCAVDKTTNENSTTEVAASTSKVTVADDEDDQPPMNLE